jgi:hypothetical protein
VQHRAPPQVGLLLVLRLVRFLKMFEIFEVVLEFPRIVAVSVPEGPFTPKEG